MFVSVLEVLVDTPWTALADDLGPEKVLFVRDPNAGLEAMVVVDNVACGHRFFI